MSQNKTPKYGIRVLMFFLASLLLTGVGGYLKANAQDLGIDSESLPNILTTIRIIADVYLFGNAMFYLGRAFGTGYFKSGQDILNKLSQELSGDRPTTK